MENKKDKFWKNYFIIWSIISFTSIGLVLGMILGYNDGQKDALKGKQRYHIIVKTQQDTCFVKN